MSIPLVFLIKILIEFGILIRQFKNYKFSNLGFEFITVELLNPPGLIKDLFDPFPKFMLDFFLGDLFYSSYVL